VGTAEPHDHHDVIGHLNQRQRVDHLGQRRRVDDHDVGHVLGVLDQVLGGGQRELVRHPLTGPVDQQQLQVLAVGLGREQRFAQRQAVDQDACDAARGPHPQGAADLRAPQVGLDQDHALAGERERCRQVERRRGLALRGTGAGDHHRARAATLAAGRGECRAQGSERLHPRGRELVRRDDLAPPPAALLGNPGEYGEPVQRAQLLLAPQPRVQRLGRKCAADAEHEAGDDPGDDAQLAFGPGGRGRLVGARVDPHRGVAAGAQRAQLAELLAQRVGCLAGQLADGLDARFERLDAAVDGVVELHRAVLHDGVGKGVGEVLGRDRARSLGRHDHEVALRERLGGHVAQQRTRAAVGLEVLLRASRHVDGRDQAGGGGDVARGIARSRDRAEARERHVVARHGRHEDPGGGLVGLLGGAHVQHGGERRDEHREDDQLEPLPDGLYVAAQPLLLARRDQPVGLCLDRVDQIRLRKLGRKVRIVLLTAVPGG
jgi:hypothetical protein